MSSIQTPTNGVGFFVHKRGGLRRRWHSFIALEPADRLLFLKLWGQLAIVSLLLRLLIWWFLRRRGLEVELRIGVNNHEKFLAHAWVELAGRPVNDHPDIAQGFQPFDRVP